MHRGQSRISGEPYISHPLEVARILAEMRQDPESIAAGILHDTVEDTAATIEEVRNLFGEQVGDLVEGVTKLAKLDYSNPQVRQAENYRKMLVAMSHDIRVIIIKLADRLHNAMTLGYLPPKRRERIARETEEIYAPLANRLGIGWLKSEFEDLSFKFLMPDTYNELANKVAKKREEQEKAGLYRQIELEKQKSSDQGKDYVDSHYEYVKKRNWVDTSSKERVWVDERYEGERRIEGHYEERNVPSGNWQEYEEKILIPGHHE